MENLGNNIFKIDKAELLPVIMEKKNENWRLAQICCSYVNDTYEISYSFAKEYEIQHFRLVIDKDDSVASISRVYRSSVFYENEITELFGLHVTHMKLDLHDKLYRINTETPFAPKLDPKEDK